MRLGVQSTNLELMALARRYLYQEEYISGAEASQF